MTIRNIPSEGKECGFDTTSPEAAEWEKEECLHLNITYWKQRQTHTSAVER